MRIDVMTLFPAMFEGFLNEGIVRLARRDGLLDVHTHDFRECTTDRHRSVDDRPFGGGPGMVLTCDPVFRCDELIVAQGHEAGISGSPLRIMLSPQGRRLDMPLLEELARAPWLSMFCGHYEGFDERIRLGLEPLEVSIGDYVLSGGEVPAMVVIDGLTRLIPGALGAPEGARDDSFANSHGLLEGPQYTRPRIYRDMEVPDVLLSGDHGKVAKWRHEQAMLRTLTRRPDLLGKTPTGHTTTGDTTPDR